MGENINSVPNEGGKSISDFHFERIKTDTKRIRSINDEKTITASLFEMSLY